MAWNKQVYSVFWTGILLIIIQMEAIESARSSGRAGGTGSSSSAGRYSSSNTAYGASSGSSLSSGSRADPGAARSPSSASRWGSSAPSGPSRVSGVGSAGTARANYGVAGTSAIRSSNNRPGANIPVASQRTPVQPTYNTHYTTINKNVGGGASRGGLGTGSLLLAGAGGAIGGYMLGSMITSSVFRDRSGCCYGCGCAYYGPPPPYYYDNYVPYRYRYQNTSTTVTQVSSSTAGAMKPVDICTLARWNMELPFTELPNMLLTFLASDKVSGVSIADKSRFLYDFFNTTAAPYGSLNATSNVFTIPSTFDLSLCNFEIPKFKNQILDTASDRDGPLPNSTKNYSDTLALDTTMATTTVKVQSQEPWFGGIVLNQWRQQVRNGDRSICVTASFAHIPECDVGPVRPKLEEPFFTSVRHILRLYSNTSSDQQMISQLVQSAKRCFPENMTPPTEIQSCLDYSLSSDQALTLQNQSSLFDNQEICKKYLNPNIKNCLPKDATFSCTVSDLVNLNVFARNYYLCDETVDPSLIEALQARQKTAVRLPDIVAGTITTNRISSSQLTSAGTGLSKTKTILGSFVTILAGSLSFFL